jgi:hypothetical protein
MDRIQVSENFYLDEFIDPHTYFNDTDNGRSRLDIVLIPIAQRLRTLYGKPIYINNWWETFKKYEQSRSKIQIIAIIENDNGINKWSGIRTIRCRIGASKSAHKLGKAIDPKGNEEKMFHIIKNNAKEFYTMGIRRLEDISITKGWLHIDTLERNTKPNSIRVVDLKKSTETIYFNYA